MEEIKGYAPSSIYKRQSKPGNKVHNIAGTYLQPHYGNGVFGNVYLSAGQH